MRFVGYKDNVEICRQFEPKRQLLGINVQVIMLKVSFLMA